MPYISRAEWERAEYITLSEAVAHISECGGCDASSAQRQLHSALKERSLRGLRWQDRQLLTRFSTDDPPMTGPDWAEAEIDWAAGTVRDHWNDTGSRHRVLLIPRHWLLQHWPPAGYRPAWFSFVAAREHVERVAHCSSHHAVEALRAALYDGAARSRFADSGETIDPARWMSPLMLLDGEPIVGEAGRSIKLCRPDIERLWRPAASHASGGGPLVALNAAIERYPENREVVMRRMEAAWQAGEITLWGRRKGHSMPEPIRDYRGLVISWHADAPKGDYYAEAHAHPAEPGVGYHRHEWEDLTIRAVELDSFYDTPATQRELLRDDIALSMDSVRRKKRVTPIVAASPSPARPLPRAAIGDSELRAWYSERIAAGTPTSEQDDWEAANKKFGTLARRDAVRRVRRELAPPTWRKQGRRKSADKTAE